jgi:hypothetical protein
MRTRPKSVAAGLLENISVAFLCFICDTSVALSSLLPSIHVTDDDVNSQEVTQHTGLFLLRSGVPQAIMLIMATPSNGF